MEKSNSYLVPAAIVVAGLIIAGAVFINNRADNQGTQAIQEADTSLREIDVPGVRPDDHILGNPNADIVIVEYSDIDCPFCAQFHNTMHRIIDEYGKDGRVAWVYRHLPLVQLHPDAGQKAAASECVAQLSDNETFWTYLDTLFERDETVADLADIAEEVGVDRAAFESCVANGDGQATVDAHIAEAPAGVGTPYNVVFAPDGTKLEMRGAQQYDVIQQGIEILLSSPDVHTN